MKTPKRHSMLCSRFHRCVSVRVRCFDALTVAFLQLHPDSPFSKLVARSYAGSAGESGFSRQFCAMVHRASKYGFGATTPNLQMYDTWFTCIPYSARAYREKRNRANT